MSKIKSIKLILFSIIFVGLGIWIAFFAPEVNIRFLNNPIIQKSIGIVSILIFGYAGILIFKKLLENKYGIKISENGIYDNSSSIDIGLIKWENIERIEKNKVFNQKFIRIIVNNPNDFIERQKNILMRKSIETNYKKYGSPIQISANSLKIRFEELYDLMSKELSTRK